MKYLLFIIPILAFGYNPSDEKDGEFDYLKARINTRIEMKSPLKGQSFTGQKALETNANGEIIESAVTSQELNFVDGVTSAIQSQINSKEDLLPLTTAGDLLYYNTILTALGIGTEGQLLTVTSGLPAWEDAPISTTLTLKGQLQGFSTVNANVGPCVDDQILIFDNAEATGWRCSALPSTSPTTTIGDLIYNNTGVAAGDARLAIGTEGQLLTVTSGIPAWEDAPVSTTLVSKGQIQTHDGTSNASFDAGADGQILVYDSATLTGLNHKAYSPLTTEGDLYIFGTEEERLAIGGQGNFLMVKDNKPYWYDAVNVKDYDDNPVGTIIAYGSTNVPSGYLLADGSCIKESDYPQLFEVIGGTVADCTVDIASDGFTVPNLKDQFLRGKSDARSVFDSQGDATAVNGLAASGGSHGHTIQGNFNGAGTSNGTAYVSSYGNTPNNPTFFPSITTAVSGGSHSHTLIGDSETRPANISVVYMIKAEGREPIFGVEKKGLSPNKAGFIIWSAFEAVPEGHLKADGSCLLKTDFPDLFENISTTFGECQVVSPADGFNIPDLVSENRYLRQSGGSLAHGTIQQDADQRIQGTLSNSTSGEANAMFSNSSGAFTLATPTNDGAGNLAGNTKYKDALFDSANVVATADESRPNTLVLTAFIKLYNNDVITGVFEQIEEVNVEKDATNENELSASINNSAIVVRENFDLIDGDCTKNNTGDYSCNWNSGLFTEIPSVVCNTYTVTNSSFCFAFSVSTTSVRILARTISGGNIIASDENVTIQVSKQGVDVTKLTQNRVIKDSSLEHYNLGDCKFSILDTTQFSTLHTGKWVRMEGQSIAGTDIDNQFGISSLPDAVSNGAFFRQAGGLSSSLRTYQTGAILNHTHAYFSSDIGTGSGAPNRALNDPDNTPTATHTTGQPNGGVGAGENRPHNIALNMYCLVSY